MPGERRSDPTTWVTSRILRYALGLSAEYRDLLKLGGEGQNGGADGKKLVRVSRAAKSRSWVVG